MYAYSYISCQKVGLPTKIFSVSRFPGNLVPRFPIIIPPWAHATLTTGRLQLMVLLNCWHNNIPFLGKTQRWQMKITNFWELSIVCVLPISHQYLLQFGYKTYSTLTSAPPLLYINNMQLFSYSSQSFPVPRNKFSFLGTEPENNDISLFQ